MKRMLVLGLSLALLWTGLSGCAPSAEDPSAPGMTTAPPESAAPATPAPGQFVFTRENFPRLDGSTSTVPLAQAVAAVLLGESREAVADLVEFSKTTQSYRNLIGRAADLLLAAEPAESIWEEKEKAGFAWEMEPFAIDGLVFVVNADNPVDSLTVEQVQKIYTGEYTNWAQVGGDDVEIIPFQRNAEAGSQTMFLKLVMGDLEPMTPPTDYVQMTMIGLVEAVRSYEDSPGAIGYTVYYYANDMKMAEGLKILSIEGAEPSGASFRDGSYPFTNPYYATISADKGEDDPARILFDWLLSGEGQALVEYEGYVPVSEVSES